MTYDYKKMKEIEEMTEGDVAWAALRLAQKKLAPPEWAIRQIERGIGDVAGAAYTAAIYEGFGSERLQWLMKMLEGGIGNVANTACHLLEHECVSPEWAMARIEQATDYAVAWAACYMAREKLAPVEWAIRQIERGIGNVDDAAYELARLGLVSPEWAIKLIEKHTGESILFWDRGE